MLENGFCLPSGHETSVKNKLISTILGWVIEISTVLSFSFFFFSNIITNKIEARIHSSKTNFVLSCCSHSIIVSYNAILLIS